MASPPDFTLLRCRASFRASSPVRFPPLAANRFRGALGLLLPEALFRPRAQGGPSGYRDRPRPFVLRAAHLDGQSYLPGASFDLVLHLFFDTPPAPFREALSRLGWAELATWEAERVGLRLTPAREARRVRVEFLTPAELKPPPAGGALPGFALLAARIWERIGALRAFYGPGPLDLDFTGLAARACGVRTAGGEIQWRRAARRSTRTGAVHPLGGFTGWVQYTGQLGEFLPWLGAACYTGAGRQTVWGKGAIGLRILE